MKKLKIKVFAIIFSLLSFFTLVVVITSITKTYVDRKNTISNILTTMSRAVEDRRGYVPTIVTPNNDSRRIYLDFTIYTIILDNNNRYLGLINNTNNDEIDEEKIKEVAISIIDNHKDNYYIGNLYFNRYAYIFNQNNTLIIMDNSKTNNLLMNQLFFDIILFVLCELALFAVTHLITKWIITPVKNSFEKQKTFVADASHELKTPLAVIIASSDAYFNDKDEKWIHNIKNESERMTKLVTELLNLAKTEEEQDLIFNYNNLSDIVESSILTFESLFYDNKIDLKYDIKKDICLLCNENLIIDLMSILIDNAIKHCEEKGKVFVNLYKKNKQIILEVKNTGLPIKKEDEEKIFERFYKVDTSRNRNSNNFGLGLAIAKNIVERHNGEISAHSSGGYTTFKVVWNQK